MKIQKLSNLAQPKLNILVYGPPGNGKTHFTGTMVKATKPLVLSAESGLLCLKKLMKDLGKDIDYVVIEKFEDVEEAFLYLKHKNEGKYDAVIMDSITEIQQACMDKILKDEKIEKSRIQDWGTLRNRMVAMVRGFRDLDVHFVVTALAEQDKDEETGTITTKPMVQGSFRDVLPGYFDEVFYIHAKETKDETGKTKTSRWLQTQGTNRIVAKDRSGVLPAQTPPDFAWIYSKILAGSGHENETKEKVNETRV